MQDEVNFVDDGVEQRKVEEEQLQLHREQWFAKLPANELTESEDMLRMAFMRAVHARLLPRRFATFSSLCRVLHFGSFLTLACDNYRFAYSCRKIIRQWRK